MNRPQDRTPQSTEPAGAAGSARPALWVAAGVMWFEALAVIVYGVLIITRMTNVAAGVGYGVAGMLIAWGVALALVGRGIALGRQWSRGPAVALQLLHLPLAWGFKGSIGWLSAALFVTAAIVLVCIFLPASTAVFTEGRRLPGSEADNPSPKGSGRKQSGRPAKRR
ncbi:hypothetical protein FOE78_15355 [Microlunatus elymi]|uniref:Integral membrane protein n=1 Tax=Microlunatus elymi TaxID=2596828 RepID=A0A516Q111_9ACTN|nr:hypothetical protein [Microlunatus elymi]QDP97120.1 hypothetical protein FOE78_15355 [Microlunatus elymi]